VAFLGVDEQKIVDAVAVKLGIGPGDTARTLLVGVVTDAAQKLTAGKCLHIVATVGGVLADIRISLEAV
jgi:hypothetical protein